MPSYKAPLDDMRFVLNEVLNIGQLAQIPGYEAVGDTETTNAMLSTTAQFSEDVLTPLNRVGDAEHCTYDRATKTVRTPTGFKDAYKQFCANGLTAIACDPTYGGMGMPAVLNAAFSEMICSSNVAFAMYPGLSHGAYNALHAHGSAELKDRYLPNLVTGEWSGTMCLTEPGAGTDLGLIQTKAGKQEDGSYAISGTKIFISAGEHDLTGNILHLVLARIDDPSTPQGTKGISLFLVPKFMPDEAGNPGERNSVHCARIEDKMGINGNSTCEISLEGARGFLVGEPNKGMKAMFVMMNEARFGVGLQALGISEAAYQNALTYALERVQGSDIGAKKGANGEPPPAVTIIHHPEVRRELLTIKSQTEGARMLAYWAALQLDLSQKHPDEAQRNKSKGFLDLLTPVIKAHFTDNAVDNANAAMQVFGGHGYIREHGMEQFARDARILRLYEGTNGIQALDLLGRKVLPGNLLPGYLAQVDADLAAAQKNGVASEFTRPVRQAVSKLNWATRRLYGIIEQKIATDEGGVQQEVAGVATDYLKLASLVAMGHMWVKMVDVAQQRLNEGAENADFYTAKIQTARFYMERVMPQMYAYATSMSAGAQTLTDIAEDAFLHRQTTVGLKSREPGVTLQNRPKVA